ncbi:hypothetical protein J4H86_14155 [Spiractinospora alimapuensis]|uniref:hypothetical protein n=1 Tax=Spiractinospora alimapuensis TaxID=2820884 RepID=UPI001F487D2B|nr:hypothetical protein [Spiractinospora alimapuensis]QVQ50109.1 hypothetical protein J4H86_14155 [Spiractinospora alimapuensis]
MPSPVRHILSVLIGIVAIAAVVILLPWMTGHLFMAGYIVDIGTRLGIFAVILLLGALMGVLTVSTFSPVGALVSGVVLVALGLLYPSVRLPEVLPGSSYPDPVLILLIGGILLTSAVFPHRWRAPRQPMHTLSPNWQPPTPAQSAMYAPPQSSPQSPPANSPWPQGPQGPTQH